MQNKAQVTFTNKAGPGLILPIWGMTLYYMLLYVIVFIMDCQIFVLGQVNRYFARQPDFCRLVSC